MGDQDPYRPVPRHQALPQGAALPDARGADRSAPARRLERRGRRRGAASRLTVAFQVTARLDENRCAIISFRMRRLIDLLVVAASHHHQPSSCIALAAATNRSATAAKSLSV